MLPALRWEGTLAKGQLSLADGRSWLRGERQLTPIGHSAQLCQWIADGRCPGELVPALALCYSLIADLFAEAMAEDAEPAGEVIEEQLAHWVDRISALVSGSVAALLLSRLQDCAGEHACLLNGPELAARLFMEVRRLHQETLRRQERLVRVLAEEFPEGCQLLASYPVLYAPTTCGDWGDLLQALPQPPQLIAAPALQAAWDLAQRTHLPCKPQAQAGALVVPAVLVDQQQRVWVESESLATIEQHGAQGGSVVALLLRWCCGLTRPAGKTWAALELKGPVRVLTEGVLSSQPFTAVTPGSQRPAW